MIDADSPTGHRCEDCGRFAGCVYKWRGPHYAEVTHCDNCSDNEVK